MDGLGLAFDGIAERYDRVRPGYPAAVFDDIAALTGLSAGARVLEVGPGPGNATRDLLARGWRVHAVEPGAALAARARANLAGRPFTVDVTRFDDWVPDGTYDLLFSATAYHWVAPEVRWRLAADVLEPLAPLALVTNRTVAGGTFNDIYQASERLHRDLAPEVEFGLSPEADAILADIHAAGDDIGAVWEAGEHKSGYSRAGALFTAPLIRSYQWETEYDAADAAALLSTYSPYLRVPPERRGPLLAGIADIVRADFGGVASRRYLAVLAVAHRREPDLSAGRTP
ncbi:class I SAM-dependent methyltransferase [Actinophytocola sp. NPDC049390]|uniref:class I SAM-dependent methyltransferase n=1 Tax=Actinophytocola sp. NPDC049390 TaxID=3363894 RepID=UPI0037AC7A85